MTDEQILVMFYYHIIDDASRGKILTSKGIFNIGLNTKVDSENIDLRYEKDDIFVPTLVINNKILFDKVLCEYVRLAYEFYGVNEVDEILAMLFIDATSEEFNNPVEYIRRKINFITDSRLDELKRGIDLGYSSVLDGEVHVRLVKDDIAYETPYTLETMVYNNTGSYSFPNVSFGISDDTGYIYTIQKRDVSSEPTIYQKKVNRALFKIGEGFDSKEDNIEKYDVGNLKDVSASFVVVSSMVIGILESIGINKIVLPSVRIVRWNNRLVHNDIKVYKSKYNYGVRKELDSEINNNQSNITEKFLRTFLRVSYHFDGLDVNSYPFEVDSNLSINNSGDLACNNTLLDEFYNIGRNVKEVHKHASK